MQENDAGLNVMQHDKTNAASWLQLAGRIVVGVFSRFITQVIASQQKKLQRDKKMCGKSMPLI